MTSAILYVTASLIWGIMGFIVGVGAGWLVTKRSYENPEWGANNMHKANITLGFLIVALGILSILQSQAAIREAASVRDCLSEAVADLEMAGKAIVKFNVMEAEATAKLYRHLRDDNTYIGSVTATNEVESYVKEIEDINVERQSGIDLEIERCAPPE